MSTSTKRSTPRRWARSSAAVLAGLAATAIPALAIDHALHALGVFAPWGQVTHAPAPYLLAISYRLALGVLGFWLIARLAPSRPTRHVGVAAALALLVSTGGVLAALSAPMGPIWYPIVLLASVVPTAQLALALHRKGAPRAFADARA
jgi:hypothetical protein